MKALTLCCEPGCDELVKRGRCAAHERGRKDELNLRYRKTDTHVERTERHWRMIRARFIKANPRCARCPEAASHVHHIIDRADGGTSEFANLEGLCQSCHNRHTALHQPRLVPRRP